MTSNRPTDRPLLRRPATWIVVAAAAVIIVVSLVLTSMQHPASQTTATHPTTAPTAVPTGLPSIATPAPTPSSTATSPIPRGSAPVKITAKPAVAPKVTVSIAKLKAVKGTADGAGDVAGPAIQVTMSVHNATAKPISFDTTVVSLYYTSELTPGPALPGPGVKAFSGTLKAGGTATGVYVFSTPVESRKLVTITFDYSTKHPIVVFQGAGPTS